MLSQNSYTGSIQKAQIADYLESDTHAEWSKKKVADLQNVKEAIAQTLFSNFEIQNPEVKKFSNLEKNARLNKLWDQNYISDFKKISQLVEKYAGYSDEELKKRSKSMMSFTEIAELNEFLQLKHKKNSYLHKLVGREILFDEKAFDKYQTLLGDQDADNVPCFFERDKSWMVYSFSLNDLVNDIKTFWIEDCMPFLNAIETSKIVKKFPHFSRKLKHTLVKTHLQSYRDLQEEEMYGLPHYENNQQTWKLAEQVVEWMFRHFAHLSQDYEIKVEKASIWEDVLGKVDLVVVLKNQKTWVSVKKELQITINTDETVLKKKKNQLKTVKNSKNIDVDLLVFYFDALKLKVDLWKNYWSPVWGLQKLLNQEEKDFIAITFERIVGDLEKKSQEK